MINGERERYLDIENIKGIHKDVSLQFPQGYT